MPENEEEIDNTEEEATPLGFEIVSWEISEYQKHDRGRWWYLLYGLIAAACLVYALWQANFLFAVIIVIGSLSLLFNDARHPRSLSVVITTEGVVVGNNFYSYDDIKHFSIVYKPQENLKRLYFEFKSFARHRLSLALHDTNPLYIREHLIKYLPEDLDRNDEPASEFFTRFLKL